MNKNEIFWDRIMIFNNKNCGMWFLCKVFGTLTLIILCWPQSDGLTVNILSQYYWLLVRKTIIRNCCKCVALFTIQIERSYFLKCSQVGSRTVTAKASSLFYSLATELHWQEIGFNVSFPCSIHGLLLFYAWNCNLSCCGFLAWFLFISFKCIPLSYVAFQKKKNLNKCCNQVCGLLWVVVLFTDCLCSGYPSQAQLDTCYMHLCSGNHHIAFYAYPGWFAANQAPCSILILPQGGKGGGARAVLRISLVPLVHIVALTNF